MKCDVTPWRHAVKALEGVMAVPGARPPKAYRGNLHGHSTHSDGLNSPAEAVRLYRDAG